MYNLMVTLLKDIAALFGALLILAALAATVIGVVVVTVVGFAVTQARKAFGKN